MFDSECSGFRQQRESKWRPRNAGARDCFCYIYGIFIIVVMIWYIFAFRLYRRRVDPPRLLRIVLTRVQLQLPNLLQSPRRWVVQVLFYWCTRCTKITRGPIPPVPTLLSSWMAVPAQQKKRRIGQAQKYCFNPPVLSPMFVWDEQLCTMPRKYWTQTQGKFCCSVL